jgi:hypothetical protein
VQIIVAIPEAGSANERSYASLARLISGVPLLVRTLATAQRAGADEILLLAPKSMSLVMANAFIEYPSLRNKGGIRLVQVKSLNPDEPSDWLELQHRLEEHFIWLPWNWVTDGCLLANLPKCAQWGNNWTAPRWVSKTAVTRRPNDRALCGNGKPKAPMRKNYETVPKPSLHNKRVLNGCQKRKSVRKSSARADHILSFCAKAVFPHD